MNKTINQYLALLSCLILLTYCSKEPDTPVGSDFNFTCDSPQTICARPDSIGTTFAEMDCDGGGISNVLECRNGTDFKVGDDDCAAAVRGKIDICLLIRTNSNGQVGELSTSHVLAQKDCDGGGLTNIEECMQGFNPLKDNDFDELNNTFDNKEIDLYLDQYLNNGTREVFSIVDTIPVGGDTLGIVGSFSSTQQETILIYGDSTVVNIFVDNNTQDTFKISKTPSGVITILPLRINGEDLDSENIVTINYSSSHLDYQPNKNSPIFEQIDAVSLQEVVLETDVQKNSLVKDLIRGLQEGLDYFETGSKGTIIVPSKAAYGQLLFQGIPSYGVIIFDEIELQDVQ